MKFLNRSELHEDYKEMMKTETHHQHGVVEINGMIRWEENKGARKIVDICGLNCVIESMLAKGITKNSEEYRQLYRDLGYSLSGYWEIFYWDMNNEDTDDYEPPENTGSFHEDFYDENKVAILQYKNLRVHFNKLVTDVLGESYYNTESDVYGSDERCCLDITNKIKPRWTCFTKWRGVICLLKNLNQAKMVKNFTNLSTQIQRKLRNILTKRA